MPCNARKTANRNTSKRWNFIRPISPPGLGEAQFSMLTESYVNAFLEYEKINQDYPTRRLC